MLQNFLKKHRFAVALPLACAAIISLSGCDWQKNQLKTDRDANLEMQDYRDSMAPRLPEEGDGPGSMSAADSASIPGLQSYVTQSTAPMKVMPLVSISVNQTVPLRDALFELAKQADYDLELDPRISGSVIFTARERPFDQVIARLCEIANLRYTFEENVLRVEVDTPYNKLYKVDYLSYIRSNKGNVRNDIGVVSGEGTDTGSSFETSSESESNFWGELETTLTQILGGAQGSVLKTKSSPKITATEQNPNVQAVAPTTDASGNVQVQPPSAVLNVESLPTEEEAADASGATPSGETDPNKATFALNKQAGLVNVYATSRAHKQVEEYLKALRRAVTAQVLIEAKILEVTLNDEYATGIDWRVLDVASGDLTLNFLGSSGITALNALGNNSASLPNNTTVAGTTGPGLVLGYTGNDVNALIRAVSSFGTVRALASPRMTVLNNQSAVLNVANNRVFFDIDIDVTQASDNGPGTVDISSDIRNVPEGVLVNVQPSINLENGTISMAVRPTVTRIVASKEDPAIQYITAANDIDGVASLVPELNVQEIDSVIQTRSGQPIIMGGLLQDRIASSEQGIPGVSEVPVVGNLFKQHRDLVQKTELIIFLKATILPTPEDSVHDADRDLYRQFSGDRRPLKL